MIDTIPKEVQRLISHDPSFNIERPSTTRSGMDYHVYTKASKTSSRHYVPENYRKYELLPDSHPEKRIWTQCYKDYMSSVMNSTQHRPPMFELVHKGKVPADLHVIFQLLPSSKLKR